MNTPINFTTEIWQEGAHVVAWTPELDVSSMGTTVDEARKNLREAVEFFLEETEKMGTTQEILEESGYTRDTTGWRAPERLVFEKMSIAVS